MRLSSEQIALYTHAEILVAAENPQHQATSITWDSREVTKDCVYVAFPGERVDGHDFISEALKGGAHVILAMTQPEESVCSLAKECGAAILLVSSTREAFTQLASQWRNHISAKVIVLTGSTGKTTTKNLVRDVLSTAYKTVATRGNQNNELGVPKTLLDATEETECLVVEMGMRGRGQLESLCEFVKPDYALITNVGECHIELLGSKENIALAKAEVLAALQPNKGTAIVNGADAYTPYMIEQTKCEERGIALAYYDGSGEMKDAVAYAENPSLDSQGCPSFILSVAGEKRDCTLSLRGMHNVHNACAAAALGSVCGVSLDNIIKGLSTSLPEVGRQEVLVNNNGVTVINDAYNANPDSMKASLTMFDSMKIEGKRYAVLGDMGELGSFAKGCHEGIGRFLAQLGSIDYLICVGSLSANIASAAVNEGFPGSAVMVTEERSVALTELLHRVEKGDAVLVKASHSMELEKIVKGLMI
ncbi:MAG: UDP-N-acetylmuramoyl-tripeptide--D-alanyl-D-alanine ligase [Anaerotardibacter sp.]